MTYCIMNCTLEINITPNANMFLVHPDLDYNFSVTILPKR